jgi:hypothetical protein
MTVSIINAKTARAFSDKAQPKPILSKDTLHTISTRIASAAARGDYETRFHCRREEIAAVQYHLELKGYKIIAHSMAKDYKACEFIIFWEASAFYNAIALRHPHSTLFIHTRDAAETIGDMLPTLKDERL